LWKFLSNPAEVGHCILPPEELKELKVLLEGATQLILKELVEGLAHLRSVLEQHAQADAAIVFNEV